MTADLKPVTWQQAADAVEALDDFARMTIGVDASGPRETLYRFLEQCKRAQAPAEGGERAAFEAWAVDQPRVAAEDDCFERDYRSPERYANGTVQSLWLAWLARAAQPNVQPKGGDKASEWRKLAQQFDGQRMAAMVHLRTLLALPDTHAEAVRAFLAATPAEQIASVALAQATAPAPEVPQGPRTEFVLNELRSALNAMTTFFGMDEDEDSKPTFDKARQALNYAEIVMRPLEPWERQSLEDFRACVHRWHEKAVAKGYDGVEAMCDTALPYGTRDLRLVSASPAVGADRAARAWAALTEPLIDEFLEDYEMVGEDEDGRDACHVPTDGERFLIKDAVMGLLQAALDHADASHVPVQGKEQP